MRVETVSWRQLTALIGASVLLHLGLFAGVKTATMLTSTKKPKTVTVKIVEIPKEKEPEPEVKKKIPPRKKPEKPKPKKVQQTRKPKKEVKKNAKKIQGLTEESLAKDSKVAAPVGNTLMKRDEGKRLSPDEVAALERDLSSDAILVQGSFVIPEYTQPALDADLEGRFIVDVYVDEEGKVLDAELRKNIGYGMDERVLEVAKMSKFIPRKNAKGIPMGTWTEIAFYLEIP